ncbi:diacylglycerol kinase family protein [Salipaludibacillus agaradhaerens]|uniref:Diacylglycerol kinase family protein n=1 Tax=Salipaludibacillus agaradhaerens TaxID=76935 RepID=A0A9Q4FXL2_SALAG|nr:diacylglycerol kinase family protein [Salipaludibacillus agaradhaerens]MCR6113661.1 diacylglycerol kinase family protein [Salipaludibacillus agaradhaerens]
MGSRNNIPFVSWRRLRKSFYYAAKGIEHTWKNEQNFRIHVLAAIGVFIVAQLLNVPLSEQVILAVVIGAVLGMELINTAIEHVVDLVIKRYDEQAKIIKDAAAGAVFVFALTAAIVGAMIFIPHILQLLL